MNRVNLPVGGRFLSGVGQVDTGTDGFAYDATTGQGGIDVRRQLEVPAGVPGVLMMSATNRTTLPATSDVPPALRGPSAAGQANQLTYYSNYGSRIDLAAPGGSTKFNISVYDGGPNNPLAGWGDFGPSASQGLLCNYPPFALLIGAFFDKGTCFIWIPGTSMATANVSGVAALTLSTHRGLRGHPEQFVRRLQRSVRTDMVNHTTPLDPTNTAAEYDGASCPTGYCHLRASGAIRFRTPAVQASWTRR